MKRLLALLISLLLISGCAGMKLKPDEGDLGQPTGTVAIHQPETGPSVTITGQGPALEQLVQKSGTNVVRAFTCLTGGTTGCLDKISHTVISDGDIAIVMVGQTFYPYEYDTADPGSESSPTIICPDSASDCSSGAWLLARLNQNSLPTTISNITFDIGTATANTLIKADGNGVLGTSYFVLAGPTQERTYTFPDANATIMDKSIYDAHTVLYATSDNTPAALTVTEQTVVGRATGGNIAALAIDSDLASTSGSDDSVPSAKATKAYVDSGTSSFTNKTFDANGTGNVLKGYGYITLKQPHQIGSACGAVTTTATDINYGMPSFADDVEANNYINWFIEVPRDIDTGVDLVAWFKFRLGGADTADHDYIISMVSIADSAAQAGTPANAINLSYTADGSGASGDIETAGGDTLTAWRSNVTAGQLWMIQISRDGDDGTNDASTVDSYPVELTIRYGWTQ